jgi:chemotaxis family two-component system response regulator Rcp1
VVSRRWCLICSSGFTATGSALAPELDGLFAGGWSHVMADGSESSAKSDETPPGSLLSPLRETAASTSSDPLVVVVEDNRADVFLVERAIEFCKLSVRLKVIEDGEEALKYVESVELDGNSPCPDAILLDLNLPRRSGREVLQIVRQAKRCREVPVIILTSSNSPEDRQQTAALGATRYFRKPTSYQEFLKIGDILGEVLKKSIP